MKYASKKIISVVLIVAMVFVNNGFFVLADSIEKVVEENTLNQDESEKFYYEEETLVKEEVAIEYEEVQESVDNTIEENENDSTEEKVEEVLDVKEDVEVKEEDIEEKEEDELVDAANESLDENNVNDMTLEENINEIKNENDNNEEKENKNEIKTQEEKSENENEEVLESKEEMTEDKEATSSEIEEEENEKSIEEKVEEKDVSTESDIEKIEEKNDENVNEATISTVTEKEEKIEVATLTEIEKNEIDEEKIATGSNVEKVLDEVATVSEVVEVATISEVIEKATESVLEEKTKVYATVSVVNWKVKKVLIATYSKAYTRLGVNETGENNLTKYANVILVNDEGEEKIVRVPLKWKLEKRFDTKISNNSNADLNKNIDAFVEEKKNEKIVIPATSSVAKVVEKIKTEINDENNEAVITVLNESKEENTENNFGIQEEEKQEEIIKEESKEDSFEEETFVEDEKEKIENIVEEKEDAEFVEEEIEPTVAGFDNTEIIEESKKEDEIATQGEIEKNQVELLYEDGFVNAQKENGEKQINFIEIYSIDNEALSNEILNVLNEENEQSNEEKENINEEKIENVLDGILSFLGLNQKNDEDQENDEKNIKKEENVAIGLLGSSIPNISTQLNLGATLVAHEKGDHTIMSTLDADTVSAKVVNIKMFTGDDGKYETGDSNPWLPYYFHTIVGGEDKVDASREEVAKEQMETLYPQYATQNQVVMEGNYYLNDDLVVNEKWVIRPGKVLRICLNGKSIRFNLKKNAFTEFFEEGRIGKAIDINGKIANGEEAGGGALIICNCTDNVSTITASAENGEKFVENCKDGDFGKTGTKYTRWKAHSLINTEKVFIAGSKGASGKNIVIGDTEIKNVYRDEVKVVNKNDEKDYPDFTGDGSVIAARELCVVTNTLMENSKATRAVGVFINTLFGRLIVYNSDFTGSQNTTGKGGAIAFNTKSTYMEKVSGKKSTAVSNGGFLYGKAFPYSFAGQLTFDSENYGAKGTMIKNCEFDENLARNNGGTLYLDDFGGDRRVLGQVWSETIVDGCDQVNIVSTKFTNSSKKENAGYLGGMIALKHDKADPTSSDYTYNFLYPGKLNIKECVFKDAKMKKTNMPASLYGGAIALYDKEDERLIDSITIEGKNNENTFEECVIEGYEITVQKPTGATSLIANTFGALGYGGAIYAKNVKDILLQKVTMKNNVSFEGANLYIDNSNLVIENSNIIEGNGGEKNDKADNIYNKVVTPAGGVAYITKNSKVSIINSNISKNLNAFFLDNIYSEKEAILELKNCNDTKIVDNVGEYLIGSSNKGNNRVIFNDTQIIDHNFRGPRKDFYSDISESSLDARIVCTKVQFNGTKNYIRNNTRTRIYTGNKETKRICNLEIRSSKSNIRLDLSNLFDVNANQAGGKGIDKIGLTYDIEDDAKYNNTVAFDEWGSAAFTGGAENWNYRFDLDEKGKEEILHDKFAFILKGGHIVLSTDIVKVVFKSYIDGVAEIPSIKIGMPEGPFKVPAPSEMISGGGDPNKTIVGFMGIKAGETEYSTWNFETDLFGFSEGLKEVVMIPVYTDDTVKFKACGCVSGVNCNHVEQPGVNHKDRGNAISKTEEAKWKNYVIIGTPEVFNYKYINDSTDITHYNKYTQYVLYKDFVFTKADLDKYLSDRDVVLNLGGKKLTIESWEKSAFTQKNTGSIDYGIVEDDVKDRYFINGISTTSKAAVKGIITINSAVLNKGQKAIFDTNGNNLWLANTEVTNVIGSNDSDFITSSTGAMDKLNILGCNINNINADSLFKYKSFTSSAKHIYIDDTVIDKFNVLDAGVMFSVEDTYEVYFNKAIIKNCVNQTKMIHVKVGGKFVAKDSTITNNKFTNGHIYAIGGIVQLHNTEIIAASNDEGCVFNNQGAKAVVTGKVIIKSGTTAKSKGYYLVNNLYALESDENIKLASGSHIELSADDLNNNLTFFKGWSEKYVEYYNHIVEKGNPGCELPENWFYGTQEIFTPDSYTMHSSPSSIGSVGGRAVYIKGTGDLQEVCIGSDYSVVNFFNDTYGIPEYQCSFFQNIAGNYVSSTQLPIVQIGYFDAYDHSWVGTTSGAWRNVVLSEWVETNAPVGDFYERQLVKYHAHKICGLTEEPCNHANGQVHAAIATFNTVISNEAIISELKKSGKEKRLVLGEDLNLSSETANEISSAYQLGKLETLILCLNGYELTFASNIETIQISGSVNFTITNCSKEGNKDKITVEGGLSSFRTNKFFDITANGAEFNVYNATFSNINISAPFINTTKGTTLLEKTVFDNCNFNTPLGAIYQEDPAIVYLDRLTFSNNTAENNPLLKLGNQTIFKEEGRIKDLTFKNNKFNSTLIDFSTDTYNVARAVDILNLNVVGNIEYGNNNAKLMMIKKDGLNIIRGTSSFVDNEASGGIIVNDNVSRSKNQIIFKDGELKFVNNKKGPVVNISTAGQALTITFNGKTIFENNLNGAVQLYNGNIEFNEEAIFDSNKKIETGKCGAALDIKEQGVVSFSKKATFVKNVAYSKGGAIYNEHKLKFSSSTDKIIFASNSVIEGGASAIYTDLKEGEETVLGTNAIFEGNGSVNSGYVIEYRGKFDLEKAVFNSNTGEGLIGSKEEGYSNNSVITLKDLKFANNNTKGAAIGVEKLAGTTNLIQNIESTAINNFGSLIVLNAVKASNSKATIKNLNLTSDNFSNSVINVDNVDKPIFSSISVTGVKAGGAIMNIKSNVLFEKMQIINNITKDGAVVVTSLPTEPTSVFVKDTIKINYNKLTNGTKRNVVIKDSNSRFVIENPNDLKADSSISFYSDLEDTMVLKNWDYIEYYDKPMELGDYSISPERNNKIVSDYSANQPTGRYIYKVGGDDEMPMPRINHVDLYLGKQDKFVTIKFTDGTLVNNYAEQNVKANAKVRLDLVKFGDWEIFKETSTGTQYIFNDPIESKMSPRLSAINKESKNVYYAMLNYSYNVVYSAGKIGTFSSLPNQNDYSKGEPYHLDDKVKIVSRTVINGLDATKAWEKAGGEVYEWVLDTPRTPLTEEMRWISFDSKGGEIGPKTANLSPSSEPAVLTAIWEKDVHIVKYVGIYDGLESTYSSIYDERVKGNTFVVNKGQGEDIPYYKFGYDFVGYYAKYALGRGGYGTPKKPGQTVQFKDEDDTSSNPKNISIVLYAVWEKKKGIVNFVNVVDKVVGETKMKQYLKATFSAPDPVKDLGFDGTGLKFKAYHTVYNEMTQEYSPDEIKIGDTVVTEDDAYFYLEWERISNTVTYDGNGATSGTMETEAINYGESYTIKPNKFVKTGYTFVNWQKDDTEKKYANNANIPAEEITGAFTLIAQWKKNSPGPTPTPTPVPGPSGGGGGGGGGSGGGSRQTQGYWRDGEYNPLTGGVSANKLSYTVRVDGAIISPDGNIVGSIFNNDRVNADGSFTDNQNVTHFPDGRVMDPTGIIHNIDGTLTDKNGNIINSNGIAQQIENQITQNQEYVDANGMRHLADGTKISPDGITYFTDGSTLFPDGTKVMPDGTVVKPTVVNSQTNGTWVTDPVSGKETFVKKDANGLQITAADEWVMQNNSGKESWYAVDKNGFMITGWLKDAGEYYYLTKEGANKGSLTIGSVAIDGVAYKFDNEGKLVSGEPNLKELTVMGATNHKSGIDGNWSINNLGERIFTMNIPMADGSNNKSTPKSWYMIDGSYYYFNENGTPMTGLVILDNKYYYFKEDGKMQEGGEIVINNVKYTFDKATGACRQALPLN